MRASEYRWTTSDPIDPFNYAKEITRSSRRGRRQVLATLKASDASTITDDCIDSDRFVAYENGKKVLAQRTLAWI